LGRDNEGFVITTQDNRQRIPISGVSSILVAKGALISSDAMLLAIENEIEVIIADKMGNPQGRIWSPRYGSISTIRKGQLVFTRSKDALEWIKELLSAKIKNQQATILAIKTQQDNNADVLATKAISRLEEYKNKIENLEADLLSDVVTQLRGWEGVSAKIYFDAINLYLPEQYRFEQRSQHPALDVANVLLNYGYGILYGKIEGALIKVGIDPYIGVMHRDEYSRPVLVYDVIERYRVWVDYIVFSLLQQQVITEEFYSVKEDGSYWLEPLGRRVLIQSMNDYLSEVIDGDSLRRSREMQISLYVQDLAQTFKKLSI
jgi:CRISPR-associated protein Cas1